MRVMVVRMGNAGDRTSSPCSSFFFFFFSKQKTAYEISAGLEFRRVLFRSRRNRHPATEPIGYAPHAALHRAPRPTGRRSIPPRPSRSPSEVQQSMGRRQIGRASVRERV